MQTRLIFVVIASLSIISLLMIIINIISNKKMRQHPAYLIAGICTIEAILTWQSLIQTPQIGSEYYICYLGIDNLLSATLYIPGVTTKLTSDQSLNILTKSQLFFYQHFQLSSLFINLTFCMDLIQTLKNPFSTTKLRLWQYLTFSIVAPFFIVGTLWLTFNRLIYTNQFKLKDGDFK